MFAMRIVSDLKNPSGDFPGDAVVKTLELPMQGAQVRSLVRELDPTCMPQLRVLMPQLRSPPAATKEPVCLTKTQCNQIDR